MYQTSGFVNEDLLTQIGVYFIPYQSRMVFRVCINLFVVLFFGFICVLKLLPAAIMLSVAIFFWKAQLKARKRCREATVRQLKELSGSARIRYSSKFNKDGIQAENYTTRNQSTVLYTDIVEVVPGSDTYLLVSRKGELVFVFRSRLEDEADFINFLLGRQTGLMPWHKMKIRMLAGMKWFMKNRLK